MYDVPEIGLLVTETVYRVYLQIFLACHLDPTPFVPICCFVFLKFDYFVMHQPVLFFSPFIPGNQVASILSTLLHYHMHTFRFLEDNCHALSGNLVLFHFLDDNFHALPRNGAFKNLNCTDYQV